jgi:acyl-CoA thioesterase
MGYLDDIKKIGRGANPFFLSMEIEIESFGEGEAVLSMPIRPSILNGQGWMQGGLFVALADEAMALALYTVLEDGELIATISENTSFLQGIRDGRVIAEGKVLKRGRQVAFTEGVVRRADETGDVLSETRAYFTVIAKKKAPSC